MNDSAHKYVYDAENRIACVDPVTTGACANGAAATFVYDAEGKRVKTHSYEYLYDLEGRSITLLDAGTGAWDYGEIYAGARHLATYSNGTTTFDHSDWVGTERMRTSPTGTVAETCISLPFGDGFSCTGTDYSFRHFTGKEHDNESGLDNFGARYDSSSMGRFMTPDPLLNSGKPWDPQSWNRYSYVRNNPLSFVDPTGLYDLQNNCAGDDKKCNKQFEQNAKNLKNGLANLQKRVDKMKDGTEKTRLENSLKALGTEGDHNNVSVTFGALAGNAAGNTETSADAAGKLSFKVTFDPSKISGQNDMTIDAAHEGTHVSDISDPRYANTNTELSPFQLEYRGYQTSGWAAQTLGVPSLTFGNDVIWNSSWAAADRQTLMDKGITNHVTSIPGHPDTKPDQHNPWPN